MDNAKGKLIVIEGLDGSGKSTQSELIYNHLKQNGEKVKLISYPDYSDKSSALVKMYLDGEFSSDLNAINAYAASSFYAVDRYASFKRHWEKDYLDGYTIIATRYVSSNAVHQMVKLPQSEWDCYLDWLDDYEFVKLELPRPDKVIFLDMPRKVADSLLLSRYNGDASKRDIHESNISYLEQCQLTAKYSAQKLGWSVIACNDGEKPLPLEIITDRILEDIKK